MECSKQKLAEQQKPQIKNMSPQKHMNLTPVGVAPPKSHALLGCARVIKTRS
jgi:hypothetical protein